MRRHRDLALGVTLGLTGALGGCGGLLSSNEYEMVDSGWADGSGGVDGSDGSDGSDGADGTWDDGYGSEEPDAVSERLLRPAATPDHLFIANEDRDTVTRVSLGTLEVLTAPVGSRPAGVVPTSDESRVVVLNVGSHSLSVLDTASLEGPEVVIRPHLNALDIDPAGRWAVARYSEAAKDDDDPTPDGAQSYNEVSFVHLDTATHHPLVVGFNPRDVHFTADGGLAVIVSDAWLALVDLTGDAPVTTRVRIAEDTVNPPVAEEVVLTPDGATAVVRQYAQDELVLVDLATGAVDRVEVGGNPTDLDLTPDGATLVAVSRTVNELWLYDTADLTGGATVVAMPEGEVFGSIAMSADGSQALLYSTASEQARYGTWTVGETDADAIAVRSLVKEVAAVALSPDGGTALITHADDGAGADPDGPFWGEWALTLVELSTHFANPLLLSSEPKELSTTDDGRSAAFFLEGEPYLEVVDFRTLLYEEVPLRSDPLHAGPLPDTRVVWVSQEHDLGRISFYDIDADDLTTITGFELNAGIEVD